MSEDYSDLDDLDPKSFDLLKGIRSNLSTTLFATFGILFVVIGLIIFFRDSTLLSNDSIEVLEIKSEGDSGQIYVEVSGAVKNPGVYELDGSSRVEHAIQLAGGTTADADNEWMQKVLNRAAFLQDGQKIFIPPVNQQSVKGSATENVDKDAFPASRGTGGSMLVNINTATLSELESLWGIGPVTGQNVIDQRPYSSVDELLARKILKSNVYERNKDLLTVH